MMKLLLPSLLLLGAAGLPAQEAPNPVDKQTQAWHQFKQQHGGHWQAVWNKATGTPKAIFGPGLTLKQGSFTSPAEASHLAEKVLADHATLLGRGASSFAETTAVRVGDNYIFVYDQYYQGLAVIGGRADVRLHHSGRLAMFGAAAVQIPAAFDTKARLTQAQAMSAARSLIGAASADSARLVIWADTEGTAPTPVRLAWEVEVSGPELFGMAYIDAMGGRLIEYDNRIYRLAGKDAPLSGTVKAWTNTALTPTAPLVNAPLANLKINVPGVGTFYTDAKGNFSIPYTGTTPVNLPVNLVGRHIQDIRPLQGTRVTTTVPLTPGTPAAIQLLTATAAEFDRAQTTVYWAVDSVNEYVRGIITSGGSTQLNHISQIRATVNNTKTCNAYYTNNTINFYNAGGGCNNTAFSTVITHEWGHGLDDAFGGISQTDGLSEGWADIVATYHSGQPVVGQNFRTTGGIIRTALNTRTFPAGGSVHQQGEPWMGGAWDIRGYLIASLGQAKGVAQAEKIYIGSIPADATNQPDAMREVFLADDDDANLLNGTPNYDDLVKGATKRNIPYPKRRLVVVSHQPLTSTSEQLTPRVVTVKAAPTMGTVSKVELVWDSGSGSQRREMVPIGGDTYTALLPGLLSPATMSYHVEATHATNVTERLPETGEYSYSIGQQETFFTDNFDGQNKGWTHGMTATQDDWQLGTPQGKSGSSQGVSWSDPSSAYSGSNCWGNDLGIGNYNGAYQPRVDNWLRSPQLNLTGKTGVMLRFRRWLTVEEGQYDQATIAVNSTQVWANPMSGHVLDKAWTLQTVRLAAADNNPAVTLQWRLQTDAGMHLGGWAIDDVEVYSFKQIPPPAVQLTATPAQVGPGKSTKLDVSGKANAPAFLLISDSGGPLTVPGLPKLSVGLNLLVLPLTLDGSGKGGITLQIPNDAFLSGAKVYAQLLEATDPAKLVFTASNPMILLIGK